MRGRLMVGRLALDQKILVRIQAPQQLLTIRTRNSETRGFARPARWRGGQFISVDFVSWICVSDLVK